MPKGKNADEKAANQVTEEPVKSSDERKYPYEVLKENCVKLFHVTSSTFIGATVGKEGGSYAITEMQSLIGSWLKKEVRN